MLNRGDRIVKFDCIYEKMNCPQRAVPKLFLRFSIAHEERKCTMLHCYHVD